MRWAGWAASVATVLKTLFFPLNFEGCSDRDSGECYFSSLDSSGPEKLWSCQATPGLCYWWTGWFSMP